MSGLFGGLLSVVEMIGFAIGGAVLYVLIGKKAASKVLTRKVCLHVGAITVGLLIGGLLLKWLPILDPPFDSEWPRAFVVLGGSVLLVGITTFFLEAIRKDIDNDHE
jgi:drug/metabolite transporter (DMT)-like permease